MTLDNARRRPGGLDGVGSIAAGGSLPIVSPTADSGTHEPAAWVRRLIADRLAEACREPVSGEFTFTEPENWALQPCDRCGCVDPDGGGVRHHLSYSVAVTVWFCRPCAQREGVMPS